MNGNCRENPQTLPQRRCRRFSGAKDYHAWLTASPVAAAAVLQHPDPASSRCIRIRVHPAADRVNSGHHSRNEVVVKARELKRRLAAMGWRDTGKGSKHEKWTNGIHSVAVPRHREIAEGTARAILKEAQEYGHSEGRQS